MYAFRISSLVAQTFTRQFSRVWMTLSASLGSDGRPAVSGPQKDAEVPQRGSISVSSKRTQCVDQCLLVRWECAFSTDISGDRSQDTRMDGNEVHFSGCQHGDTRTLDHNSDGSLNVTS